MIKYWHELIPFLNSVFLQVSKLKDENESLRIDRDSFRERSLNESLRLDESEKISRDKLLSQR